MCACKKNGTASWIVLNSGVYFAKEETVTASVVTVAAKHDMWPVLAVGSYLVYLVSPSPHPLSYTPWSVLR